MKETGVVSLTARSCYGHLGGKLGNRLFERLIELGWFELEEGRATVYKVTEKGYGELAKLGIDLDPIENGKNKKIKESPAVKCQEVIGKNF